MSSPASASASKLKLIHISDPHLSSLENVRWSELLNKRILGYLSWRFWRRYTHRPEILSRLEQDLLRHKADHLIISGDLTHIGTKDECQQALAWLKRLNPPARTTVIPGNHDHYAQANWQRTLGLWQEYMSGEADEADHADAAEPSPFPALRRCGPIALIGLSTAVPTPPFFASGRLGRAQLESLDTLLDRLGNDGLFRTVILHHGPIKGSTSRRRGLDDAGALGEILQSRGAELILHGHGHRFFHGEIAHKAQGIPVFSVPSASASGEKPEKRAGYNVYEIESGKNCWHLSVCSRVLNAETDSFEVKKQYEFSLAKT